MKITTWTSVIAINIFALVVMLATLAGGNGGIAGALVGGFFVLALPGYMVTAALLGPRLPMTQRIALSIAMSLALVILGGFALNALPVGLRRSSWAVFIWLVVLAASVAILARWRYDARPALGSWMIPRPRVRDVALTLAMLVTLGVGVVIAVHSAQTRYDGGFTQLWILPGATASQGAVVAVGVRNEELSPQTYQLRVQANGQPLQTYAIQLNPGAQWTQNIAVPLGANLAPVTVEAMLYRPSVSAKPYRDVHLTLEPSSGAAPTAHP